MMVTKQFKFEAAHFLPDYDGLCSNVHGHSYKLDVTVDAHHLQAKGPHAGMVYDTKALKELIQPIIDELDHALICRQEVAVGTQTKPNFYEMRQTKCYPLCLPPTTEVLAAHLWERIKKLMPEECELCKIKLQETDTLWVEMER